MTWWKLHGLRMQNTENVVEFDPKTLLTSHLDHLIDVMEEGGFEPLLVSYTDNTMKIAVDLVDEEPTEEAIDAYQELQKRFDESEPLREALISYFINIGAYSKNVVLD